MLEWKDTTSYSRDGERIPKTFTAESGSLKVTITRGHIYHPDQWVMHCFVLRIDTQPMNAKSLEDAKVEALLRVGKTLQRLNAEYEALK